MGRSSEQDRRNNPQKAWHPAKIGPMADFMLDALKQSRILPFLTSQPGVCWIRRRWQGRHINTDEASLSMVQQRSNLHRLVEQLMVAAFAPFWWRKCSSESENPSICPPVNKKGTSVMAQPHLLHLGGTLISRKESQVRMSN